jgi:hypothetical protein
MHKCYGGYMYEIWDYFRRIWLKFFGRKKFAEPYVFSSYEIISPAFFFRVSYLLQGIYLNLHPTLYAVGILADGNRKRLDGGLNIPFPPGRYTLHYVDKTDRQSQLLKITENTLDAARIVLAVKITYRVSEPIKAFEIQKPVETLFSLVEADLKEYIRTRLYEDLIGNDDSQVIDSGLVAKYIKQQHSARYPMSKVFTIIDVIVQEKEGDPMFIEKRKSYTSQVVDGESKIKIQDLNKTIAFQEGEMEQLRYRSKVELEQLKAKADVDLREIRRQIDYKEMELQKVRDTWQQTQDIWNQKQTRWLRSMQAVESAFNSPYLRDQQVREIVSKIFDEQKVFAEADTESDTESDMSDRGPDVKNNFVKNSGDELDTLTNTLFNLLDRRKPKE